MSITCEQFGKLIVAAGVLSADEVQTFWKSLAPAERPKDGADLAVLLFKAGRITPYQANEVLAGRGGSLVFGDYLLLDKLGAGGMGEVFKARHRHMKRVVALKVVSPQAMKDEAAVKRFQREVEAAARLEHPNIVTAHDSRHERGIHYLVMQYVEGTDLAALVKQQGPLPVDLAIQCVLQAARGLAYAHGEGIVHRDIKPANLLLDKKGVVKILDMGLARLDDTSADNLTGTEQVMGTVDYMSPEQAASTHAVDARTDTYSLGCTLWYLLTARKIFEGETLMSRMLKHREAPIPSLCAARDDVPYALEEIYQRMVAKHPEDRFASMNDVARELESLQANTSGLSRLAASGDSALKVFDEFTQSQASGKRELPGGTKGVPTSTRSTSPPGGDAQTVDYRDGAVGTDPKSELSVKPLPKKPRGGQQKKPPVKLIAAAAAGILAVLFGVLFIIRDKDGNELARVEAPEGSTIEVQKQPATAGKGAAAPRRDAPPPAIAPFDYKQAKVHQQAWARHLGVPVERKNSVGMTLVLIPPGEFKMGSTPEQNAAAVKMAEDAKLKPDAWEFQRLKDEAPQHRVTLTKPFWLGMTEVTLGQFKMFVETTKYVTEAEQFGFGNSFLKAADATITPEQKKLTWRTPGYAVTENSPATQVTWNDAVQFSNWLSAQEKLTPCYNYDPASGWFAVLRGTGYRLPTEAEWEYACRAGTTTQFSFGDDPALLDIYGWFDKKSGNSAHAVGSKVANAFGLFDMHGNVFEWCQDWFAADYYSKSPPVDPSGPPSGPSRVNRGGNCNYAPVGCRSAFRHHLPPANRRNSYGFRVVRVSAAGGSVALATSAPLVAPAKPITNINDPAFQAWMKAVAALPAEKQVEAVSKKLMELNPGFDGKVTGADGKGTTEIANGVVTDFAFVPEHVTDLSPVRALAGLKRLSFSGSKDSPDAKLSDLSPLRGMKLTRLQFSYTQVSDLSPLAGMPLTALACSRTRVSDLSPLKGMPLTGLYCNVTKIADLSPLQGMKLATLYCGDTQLSDLSPLKGMPLKDLWCSQTRVFDLSPLLGMNLTDLTFTPENITQGLDVVRQMKSLEAIGASFDAKFPPAEFWKKYDAGEFGQPAKPVTNINDPAFQAWMKTVAALPAEEQIEAVSKKLMELNPGFDGKVMGFDRNAPAKIQSGVVTELGFWTDKVADISPVRALVGLKSLRCGGGPGAGRLSDLSPLQAMKLTVLHCGHTKVSDLSPLQGMGLSILRAYDTEVSDLSPLQGTPLKEVYFTPQKITKGLDVIRQMKSLAFIGTGFDVRFPPDEFWKKYDAGEFGKPITPAKPITNINDPAFQAWMKAVAALPAEKQVEAVARKLVELNPGFDGKVARYDGKGTPTIDNGPVIELRFDTDHVTDISPVRALAGLKVLYCKGSGKDKGRLSDLSPLQGAALSYLYCYNTQVSDLSPLKGMKLASLNCDHTRVADLSPLRQVPLETLRCGYTPVSDLSPLAGMPSLRTLDLHGTKVTPAGIAALQKALPDCKIEWDDPAKPKTPGPAASGTK